MYTHTYVYLTHISITRLKGRKEKERWATGEKGGIPTERKKKEVVVCIDRGLFERSLAVSKYLSLETTTHLSFITIFTLKL